MNPMMNQMLQRLIQQNPQIMQSQQMAGMIQVLQSGDSVKGEEIARNLCQTYGVTPEQAMQQARQFFKF